MRITTHRRENGSGPKNEAKIPGAVLTDGSVTLASAASEPTKPPLIFRTERMIATIPKSIMMPWMKSFTAVAMYPPAIT